MAIGEGMPGVSVAWRLSWRPLPLLRDGRVAFPQLLPKRQLCRSKRSSIARKTILFLKRKLCFEKHPELGLQVPLGAGSVGRFLPVPLTTLGLKQVLDLALDPFCASEEQEACSVPNRL